MQIFMRKIAERLRIRQEKGNFFAMESRRTILILIGLCFLLVGAIFVWQVTAFPSLRIQIQRAAPLASTTRRAMATVRYGEVSVVNAKRRLRLAGAADSPAT